MATIKMYDTKGNLVDVDRNQQNDLLGQGYSFKKPTTAPTNTGTGTTLDTLPDPVKQGVSLITGVWGQMTPGADPTVKQINDAMYGRTPIIGGNATKVPEVDPLAEFKEYQDALAEAQRQSRISALGKARDSALSGLDTEKATIDPYYYDKRNEAAAVSDTGAKNFAEYMAGKGIKGSAGALPEIYRNAGLQSQIGRLDQQQAAEHSDIARRRSGIESSYQSDVANANADIDAQTMQNYINQMQTVQAQRIADLAAQGKTSTGDLTLQGQNAQNSEYERQAGLLAAQYYDDISALIDSLDPNDPRIPYLHVARREKINTQAEQKAATAAAASEAEQQAWNNAFKLFESNGRITSPEQAQILGLPMDATVADVDIARMNAATSRINATKTKEEKPKSALTTTQYFNQAKSMLGEKREDGQPKYTKSEFENWLANLPIDDQAYDEIVAALNLENANFYIDPESRRRQNNGIVN